MGVLVGEEYSDSQMGLEGGAGFLKIPTGRGLYVESILGHEPYYFSHIT